MEASILYILGAAMTIMHCHKDGKPWFWASLLWPLWMAWAVFIIAMLWLLLPIADLCDSFIEWYRS